MPRAASTAASAGGSVGDFIALMKPRVMSLVVFTALTGMVAGARRPASRARRHRPPLHRRRRRRLGRAQHVVRRRHRRPDAAHRGAAHPARPGDARRGADLRRRPGGRAPSSMLGVLVNWMAGGAARPHHRLLPVRLHHVAEAPDAAEHRHRRRRRRLPAHDRLGRRDRLGRASKSVVLFLHHLHVDAAALLGAGALPLPRLRARRRADAAGGGRPRRDPPADRASIRPCWCRWRSRRPSSASAGRSIPLAAIVLGAVFLALALQRLPRARGPRGRPRRQAAVRASRSFICLACLPRFSPSGASPYGTREQGGHDAGWHDRPQQQELAAAAPDALDRHRAGAGRPGGRSSTWPPSSGSAATWPAAL